jgi:5'-nucleotidase
MSTVLGRLVLAAAAALAIGLAEASAQPLRVMVTNDDGIAAAGIAALVGELLANPNLEVFVVAPATNQSGTGDNRSTSAAAMLAVTAGTSATALPVGGGNFPSFCDTATCWAVESTPADSVYVGVHALSVNPDIVVSGINFGQNLGREIGSELSGTVGAALTAGRLGIPAIAVSHEIAGGIDYTPGATYAANIVEDFRIKKRVGKKLSMKTGLDQRAILNVNIPNCTSGGSIRGVEVAALAEMTTINSYDLESDDGTTQVYSPNSTSLGIGGSSNCLSTLTKPSTDVEAFKAGYIALTALNPDVTVDNKLKRFKFLRKIPFE